MKTEIETLDQLIVWLNDPRWHEQQAGKPRFAFRGQADSNWELKTSLGRHLGGHLDNQKTKQWRTRELKMYQTFREGLLALYPGRYDNWGPMGMLALMQHYGAPTRMIDFTYSPRIATWFALKDAKGDSAIYIVDRIALDKRRKDEKLRYYCGPTHRKDYHIFNKDKEGQYKRVGFIRDAKRNERLVVQRGCFFVVGSISNPVDKALYERVVLLKQVAIDSREHLSDLSSDLTPQPILSNLAKEAKRVSVIGGEHFAITGESQGDQV